MGYDQDGYPYPTAAGRYCELAHKSIDRSAESETFEQFFETLRLECEPGEPAYLNWTVPMDAPDLLYYQVKMSLFYDLFVNLTLYSVTHTTIWVGKST